MEILLFVVCYIIASTPSGWIICKLFFGFDVRDYYSHNFGATNVFRTLLDKRGKKIALPVGVLVVLLDALKGFLIIWLVPWLITGEISQLIWYGAGLAAIFGHVYSVYFWGQGGKGVATAAGALAVFMPIEILLAFGIWLLIVVITKWVSLGSIFAALMMFVSHFVITSEWFASLENLFTSEEWSLTLLSLIICVVVIYKHRKNIVRIRQGTENKLKFKSSG